MEIEIKQVKKSDLKNLAKIHTRVFNSSKVGENWNPKKSYKLLEYWLNQYPADLGYFAEYNKKIVGAFITGLKPWWDGYHIQGGEMFVHPDFQKKGIGTMLIKKAFKIAKDKYKVKSCSLTTFKNIKHPLSWYKKMGFEEKKDLTVIGCNINDVLKKLR